MNSPMEQFEIFNIFSILTSFSLYLLIVTTIMLSKTLIKSEIIGSSYSIFNESMFSTLLNMIENYIGKNASIYLPLIYTIFNVILFSNLLGLIPYSTTITVEFIMTLTLSSSLLLGAFLLGLFTHKHLLFTAFLPAGTPLPLVPIMILLEILAYLIKIISLALRLAINLTTGHVLVHTIIGLIYTSYKNSSLLFSLFFFIPLIGLSLFLALELLICYLQAYIFTFIVCITLKDMS